MIQKNIVFDLGHVIFDYDLEVVSHLINTDPANAFNILEPGLEILQKCHAQHDAAGNRLHKLFVLSNATHTSFGVMSEQFPHVLNLFDGIMTSAHAGMSKPDARIYYHFLQTHNLQAKDCIFIDDKEVNVLAARAAGMYGIVCKDFAHVEYELKKLHVI